MTLHPGDHVEVTIDKPAAGGRMIARHDGQVLLVQGAIPGERVRVRIERVEKQLAFASTSDVLEPSPDRRAPGMDILCGGCLYAHIDYGRQLTLKREIVQDAFLRLGRIPLGGPVPVAASPAEGYRMRARFHVLDGRVGSYREGTHELCDMRQTKQLSERAIDAAEQAAASLLHSGCTVSTLELSENLAGDERVLHVTAADGTNLTDAALDAAAAAARLTGCTGRSADGTVRTSGTPAVTDPLPVLTEGRAPSGLLERRAESFFQGNRYLLPQLVGAVLDSVPADGDVLDLYAGVGLFAVSLAATGRTGITAVEGGRSSGADLQRNAARCAGRVRVRVNSVEIHLRRHRGTAASTIIVDPPRTGISRDAMQAVAAHGARRIIYVSCDPPTMARDARRLLDTGYRLSSVRAFDLFPNTPHVETLGVFDHHGG
jgi:23S rRNA (uracil1939-C5)-methyltransferase